MGQRLTEPELEVLAELASPKNNFVSKYEREQHKKGFKYCARLFQMFGWRANEKIYEKIKQELKPVKIKKEKALKTQQYQSAINRSALNLDI